jgi:hypothetical protein
MRQDDPLAAGGGGDDTIGTAIPRPGTPPPGTGRDYTDTSWWSTGQQNPFDAINTAYQQLLGRPIQPNLGGYQEYLSHANDPHYWQSIAGSQEARNYQQRAGTPTDQPTPPTETPTPPQPPPTGGGDGTPASIGSLPMPFSQPFTPPPMLDLGGPPGLSYLPPAPTFTPPGYTPPPAFSYAQFGQPTVSDLLADPSYQFRLAQGLGAINTQRAAQGLWGTGATAKALQDYAQNYASQEYSNVYNRSLQSYQTNLAAAQNQYAMNAQSQYLQPYEIAFQNAQAAFAPQMAQWTTRAQAAAQQNQLNYERAYQLWLDQFQQKMAQAGLGLQSQMA